MSTSEPAFRAISPMSRRQFLARSGTVLAGTALAGALGESLMGVATASAGAASRAPAGSADPLVDLLSTLVADLERKFPYASARFNSQTGIAIHRDRRSKSVSEAGFPSRGVSLRVFDGASFHEAGVGSTDPDALHAAAKGLSSEVPLARERYRIHRLPAHSESWRTAMKEDPASVPLADRVAIVDHEFDRINWDDPRVRNVSVTTGVTEVRRIFVDRNRRLRSTTTLVSHSALLFGFDKGKPGFSLQRGDGQGGLELARLSDETVERLRREFVESFSLESMTPGEYEVVFAPEVSGLLAHESFGHGVEMDQFVKGRAKAQEFLGKPVASKIVSLLDDPSVPGPRGSYPFDDEGMLAAPTRIIENGVFERPLTDLMSATFLGRPRTPNGRAQGWDRKVYARMSNTFFARGSTDPAEMLAGLKDGLYLEGFRNGIEDPQGWGIQFTAGRAREYKDGKPTGRVFNSPTVTGYVPTILSNITMVGSDFKLEPGTCGKGFKEWVLVTSGGPHLRTRARVS